MALALTSAPSGNALAQQQQTQGSSGVEGVKDMLAAQVRLQGVSCERPLGARKDARRSRPDHEVWVLRCSNATYRVGRAPDMAASIERLK